jgi:hypothetical protein
MMEARRTAARQVGSSGSEPFSSAAATIKNIVADKRQFGNQFVAHLRSMSQININAFRWSAVVDKSHN